MAHVEPAHLVELALRNTQPTEDDAEALRHVERCDRCRDELRMMTRVVTAARAAELVDLPAAPPERVWQRITQGLSGESDPPRPPPRALGRGAKRTLLAALALAVVAGAVARHTSKRKSDAGPGTLPETERPARALRESGIAAAVTRP